MNLGQLLHYGLDLRLRSAGQHELYVDADRNSDAVASGGNPTSVWEGNAALTVPISRRPSGSATCRLTGVAAE